MSVLSNTGIRAGASGAVGDDEVYEVANSLRFNNDDSAKLSRTPTYKGNRKTWTYSCWVKRCDLGRTQSLLSSTGGGTDDSGYLQFGFRSTDILEIGGALTWWLQTDAVFRDNSTWYHIVCAVDTTNSTADARIKLYVNGSQITSFATRSNPAQYSDLAINQPYGHYIGAEDGSANYLHAYMAEIHMVDGLQLDASSFGETATTGQWVPKEYTHVASPNDGTTWSSNIVPTASGFQSGFGADKMFDGNASNYGQGNSGTNPSTLIFTPPTAISFTDKVEIWHVAGDSSITAGINSGTKSAITNGSWQTVASGGGTLTTLDISRSTSGGVSLAGVKIDGKVLIDAAADNSLHLKLDPNQSGENYDSLLSPVDSSETVSNPANAFSGALSNYSTVTGGIKFTPDGGSQNVTTLRFYSLSYTQGGTIKLNGTQIESDFDFGNGVWYEFSDSALSTISNTLTSFEWNRQPGQSSNHWDYLCAIEIDGIILINYTALEYDGSGNGNHVTANNFSTTAGVGNDALADSPVTYDDSGNGVGNYCTLNPLMKSTNSTPILSNGNLTAATGASGAEWTTCGSTISVSDDTGKWYWEVGWTTMSGTYESRIGVAAEGYEFNRDASGSGLPWLGSATGTSWSLAIDGNSYTGGSGTAYTTALSVTDVIGVALDTDNHTLTFYKNGSTLGTAYTGVSSPVLTPGFGFHTNNANTINVNFGQRPFTETVPTGFKALNTFNLGDTEILSGEYEGSGAADGPVVWMNATPATLKIGTSDPPTSLVTFDPSDVDPLASGFKIRHASTNNGSGTTYYWLATKDRAFKYANAQSNE